MACQILRNTRDSRNASAHRHELEVERRRAHPGEPRRTVVSDRPAPGRDRRGSHGYADSAHAR
jgi:hypothetical protein